MYMFNKKCNKQKQIIKGEHQIMENTEINYGENVELLAQIPENAIDKIIENNQELINYIKY